MIHCTTTQVEGGVEYVPQNYYRYSADNGKASRSAKREWRALPSLLCTSTARTAADVQRDDQRAMERPNERTGE